MYTGYLEEYGDSTNTKLSRALAVSTAETTASVTPTHAKASPQPFDNTLLDASMPPPFAKNHVLVLDESSILALNKHLFRLFATIERDFLGELHKARVGMM